MVRLRSHPSEGEDRSPISPRLFRAHSVRSLRRLRNLTQPIEIAGAPNGLRTRVSAVKGRRPGPLDDGRVLDHYAFRRIGAML